MKKIIISVVLLLLSICCFCEEAEYFNVVVLDKNSRELLDNKVEYREASVSLKDTTGNIVLITNDISFNKNKEDIFYIPLDYLKNKEIIINTEDNTDTYNENHIVILAKTDYEGPFCDNNANKFLSFTKENNGETITYGVAKFYRNVDNNHHIKAIEDAKNDGLESIKQTSPQDVNIFSRTTEIIDYGIDTKECYVTTIMKYDDSYKKINLDYTKDEFEIKDKKLISYNRANTSVTIPEGIEEISAGAFQSNKSIMEVIIPNSCKKIDEYAFNNCQNLEKVNLENIDEIGQGAFAYCLDLRKNINFSNNLKVISNSAFSNCNILELTITDSVTSIGEYAFENNYYLNKLVLGNNLKIVAKSAFKCNVNPNTSLKELIIPDSVEKIYESAFENIVNLNFIKLSSNLKTINNFAFKCSNKYPNISLSELIIPNSVEYIGKEAFINYTNLNRLKLSENLKIISEASFSYDLEIPHKEIELIIPHSVEIIENKAFCNRHLSKLILGNNVRIIGESAFNKSFLGELTIPNSVEYIGDYAFAWGYLRELVIPDSVISIGDGAFINNNVFSNLTLGNNLKTIGNDAFYCYNKDYENAFLENNEELLSNIPSVELIIPDSVEIIGEGAFNNFINISKLQLGKNLKTIGQRAFSSDYIDITSHDLKKYFKLTELVIPDSVEIIEDAAFRMFINLEKLILGKNVKTIGFAAFHTTLLKELIIPDSVEKLGYGAFGCSKNLSKLILGKNLKEIGERAFGCGFGIYNNNLTELVIPDSVETIGKGAFYNFINISKLYLGKNLKIIDDCAFCCDDEFPNRVLTELIIPDSVEKIGDCAFINYINLSNIILSKQLKTLGNNAFSCFQNTNDQLVMPKLPNSLKNLYLNVFNNCSKITEITIPNSVEKIYGGYVTLKNINVNNKNYCVNNGALYSKNMAKLICYFKNSETFNIPQGVKIIGANCFYNNKVLKSINIPNSVEIIDKEAFKECENLSNLILGNNIKYINESSFERCNSLTELIIPNSVETIGERAFSSCDKLLKLTLGNNVKIIEHSAFGYCDSLKELIIPDSVESIKENAFRQCPLSKLILGKNVKEICDEAFAGCPLTEIIIPDSVETIGNSAFSCDNLYKLSLGNNIKTIGNYAFTCNESNKHITELIIPDSVETIGERAFCKLQLLSKLILGNNIKTIGYGAFECNHYNKNNSLTELTLPKSLEKIGEYAFADYSNIKKINNLSKNINEEDLKSAFPEINPQIFSKDTPQF